MLIWLNKDGSERGMCMKYSIPELDIAMFDRNIGTESMSRIHSEGNAAAQALEESSKKSAGVYAQVLKFSWE